MLQLLSVGSSSRTIILYVMVRIEYDGHKLTKAWSGRLLCEIKDDKSVEKWERDIRHTIAASRRH